MRTIGPEVRQRLGGNTILYGGMGTFLGPPPPPPPEPPEVPPDEDEQSTNEQGQQHEGDKNMGFNVRDNQLRQWVDLPASPSGSASDPIDIGDGEFYADCEFRVYAPPVIGEELGDDQSLEYSVEGSNDGFVNDVELIRDPAFTQVGHNGGGCESRDITFRLPTRTKRQIRLFVTPSHANNMNGKRALMEVLL